MWGRRFVIWAIGPLLCVTALAAPGRASGTAKAPVAETAKGGGYDVTLVTGDRVHVAPGNMTTVAPAGTGYAFEVRQQKGGIYVIPDNVETLVPDHLDPELFNVTALHAQGYGDSVPLIVTYGKSSAKKIPAALPATTGARQLASINATAVRTQSRKSAALGAALARSVQQKAGSRTLSSGALAGVKKIWLDGKVHADLADSVGQIHAPEAWQAGYDGSGVRVAVLDGGIDAAHPDLKVADAKNFSDDPDTRDTIGRGTLAASVIAGSGAASGGREKGVAPGATLISGKVLNQYDEAQLSWVIAAMEWAAGDEHADIIDMNLFSGGMTGGPLTDAVNDLTGRYGSLFVLPAGNDPCTKCVYSPADAESALTVGAVDQNDAMWNRSSRGPAGDLIKPEVTAPGVGIVGARASGALWGQPVDDHYTKANGTDLAASHVAGAAALLLQARPKSSPAELKALLMGTADPNDAPVDAKGAGRINVATAIASPVTASAGVVNFGSFSWPHTGRAPVRRTVTYRNLADQPVNLTLDVAGKGLSLARPSLTVPANGTADIEIALDTTVATPGRLIGDVTARTADGKKLRTLVGADIETEHYNIRFKATARDGRAGRGRVDILNADDSGVGASLRAVPGDPDTPCTDARGATASCIRVTPGTYHVMGMIDTMPASADSTAEGTPLNRSYVGDPEVKVTKDTEVVLDARKAKEVKIETPDHPTKTTSPGAAAELSFTRIPVKGPALTNISLLPPNAQMEGRIFLQPTEQVHTGAFELDTRWALTAPDITMSAPGVRLEPDYYDPALFSDHSSQFPRLNGTVRLPVADAGDGSDLAGRDLRGKLALIRRSNAIPVAQQSNNAASAGARMVAIYNDTPGLNRDTGGYGVMLKVPTVSLTHEEGTALLVRRPTVTATGIVRSPYLYEILFPEVGRIADDQHYVARTKDMARVDAHYHTGPSGGAIGMSVAISSQRAWQAGGWAFSEPLLGGVPQDRTEYYSADPKTIWRAQASVPERTYSQAFPHKDTPIIELQRLDAVPNQRGEHSRWSWFKASLAPIPYPGNPPSSRTGDQLWVAIDAFSDAQGNYGTDVTSAFPDGLNTDYRVYRNGTLIRESDQDTGGAITVPPEDAAYRVELDVDNHAPWATQSTSTKTAWTFHSQHIRGNVPSILPLLIVGYDAPVDGWNRATSHRLTLHVRHPDGTKETPIKSLTLAVSYDDGATWTTEKVKRKGQDYVAILNGKGMVSLKVSAGDAGGNTIDQQIIRAYEIR